MKLLHELFARSAREHPDRVAVDVPPGPARPERVLRTYAQLDRDAALLAQVLQPEIAHADCVVTILLPRSTHLLYAAQLAVLRAGAAYTCLDQSFPDEHIRFVIRDTAAALVLTDAAGLARVDVDSGAPALDVDALLAAAPADAPPPPASAPEWLRPDSLAYVIYTSGTTGRPKGVMIEHRSIVNLIESDLAHFLPGPAERVAQGSSPAYDSSLEETWLALAAGGTVVVMDDSAVRLGPDLVGWLARERITVLCPPPTLLRTTGCEDPERELPALRLLYVGGEELPADLAERWGRGRWLENGYGPTECTVTVLRARVEPGEPVAIGRPVPGSSAWVLGDDLESLPDGEAGELCVGGAGLARGYLNLPELTADRFPEHPRLGRVYRTGDLARRDPDGSFFYLGRIDSQVKLHGYRVELGAIEARLAACSGVREAGCKVQGEGAGQQLAAFIVCDDPASPPSFAHLRADLATSLPRYMVPGRFLVVPRLPTAVGGKLDRSALPWIDAPAVEAGTGPRELEPPRDDLERRVADEMRRALRTEADISVLDDFFALGGESVAAAELVSALRRDPATAMLAVRDIYEARTVRALAGRVREATAGGEPGEPTREIPRTTERAAPLAATAIQSGVLVGLLLAGSAVAYALVFVVLPWLLGALGVTTFLIASPILALAALLLYVPIACAFAVLAKRVLIGRYRPLRAPVWGSFHVRNWIVQLAVRAIPWGLVQGTELQCMALRLLGARIGRGVHIHRGVNLSQGGWDLLELGDGATLSQDASLRLVDLEDGHVVVGAITIGTGATLEVRAGVGGGAAVESGATLTALSWLPPGARIPEGERWDGVPAMRAGVTGPPPEVLAGRELTTASHSALTLAAHFAVGTVLSVPWLLALGLLAWSARLDAAGMLVWLFGEAPRGHYVLPLFGVVAAVAVAGLVLQAVFVRALGRVTPGVIGRLSPSYVRIMLKTGLLQGAGTWLSGTLLWPWWLRLAGMRIGRKCEISTIIDVVPETVEVGDESFFADGIYLGGPRLHQGTVSIGQTRLGGNTFLGNHAVITTGQCLPRNVLLGVSTTLGDQHPRVEPGSSWFGHPPFSLPRREIVEVAREVTHDPSPARFASRVFWELLRFVLPAPPLLVLLAWLELVARAAQSVSGPLLVLVVVPAITAAAAASLCALVLVLKWLLLGRVAPGQHPLWSCWCSRWDFLYVAWGVYARGLLSSLEGTLLLAPYLRAMGCTIGRRVVLGGGFAQVVDPDMLTLEDGATVSSMFQAHSFEDRVLKLDRIRIGRHATVGDGAVLFYGADIGEGARVAPHSVVMKHEHLAPGRTYCGCPTRVEGNSRRDAEGAEVSQRN